MDKSGQMVFAKAPASVANVGVGFDVMGLAINGFHDVVGVRFNDANRVRLIQVKGDGGKLPLENDKNVATHVVRKFLEKVGQQIGVDVFLEKGVPLSSGLGSSAASACAAVVAVNALFGKPFAKEELVHLAMQGEILVSGSAHADNVAPSLLGGLILIPSLTPIDIIRLPIPESLMCAVVHPHLEINTRDARGILPEQIKLHTAVKQWGGLAGFVAALYRNDVHKIGRYLQDFVIEPVRQDLIPGFVSAKNAAMDAGALACSISGSGPTLFVLTLSKERAREIATRIQSIFKNIGLESDVYVSEINRQGTQLLQER